MSYQIWAQDSKTKGLRVIRFKEIVEGPCMGRLRWIGPFDGSQEFGDYGQKVESTGGIYHPKELENNNWERME